MAKKYIGYIRISESGAGCWASDEDYNKIRAALDAAQSRCRVRLFSPVGLLNAAHDGERLAAEKNLRCFTPVFYCAADYDCRPSKRYGAPLCTWVELKRTAPRTWAVVAIYREWLPPTKESAQRFNLSREEFEEWQKKLPLFLRVGVGD